MLYQAIQNQATEWSYHSGKPYSDPFTDVELDAVITTPNGQVQRVPAFWTGERTWRVRYASTQTGRHHVVTACSDATNRDLHQQEHFLDVAPYTGSHVLFSHGPLRTAPNHRYLEHADGTPFFWLADTWWMGLCQRLRWPQEFRRLIADRTAKGFSAIQIVAGLYPDMPAFDPRGANEAGFPWEPEFRRINPAYFDQADLRIEALVAAGLVPCLVGCWGYFVRWMGLAAMRRHWRYLIARYGAYPMVWCLAGEATMPYYLSPDPGADRAAQRAEWTQIAAYVRSTDPYHHPITIHPTSPAAARDQLADPALLDIDLLQTGHGDRASVGPTVDCVQRSYATTPPLPVIDGEVCYEGIAAASHAELQRFLFWACILSGAAGHTYGANGLWQVNQPGEPYGASPHGFSWGGPPWEEAAQLPGSAQLGLSKRLLERLPWWRFAPHPEWCSEHSSAANRFAPYAAGIPGEIRLLYFPRETAFRWRSAAFAIRELEEGVTYQARFVDPASGAAHPCGTARGDATGAWQPPHPPIFQDWLLLLDTASGPSPVTSSRLRAGWVNVARC